MRAFPRRSAISAALCSFALVATGCSQPEVQEPTVTTATDAPQAEPETVVETITNSPTEEVESKEQDKCASLPNDPREQYPDGSAPGRMPAVDYHDYNYWIEDVDNNYDPCAELSWIVFRGSLGDPEGPAGTAASITDGLALYVNGVPDGEMQTFTRVEDITREGDDTVSLTWGSRAGSTAEGITAHYSVRLQAQDGHVVAVDGDVAEFDKWWNDPNASYQLGH